MKPLSDEDEWTLELEHASKRGTEWNEVARDLGFRGQRLGIIRLSHRAPSDCCTSPDDLPAVSTRREYSRQEPSKSTYRWSVVFFTPYPRRSLREHVILTLATSQDRQRMPVLTFAA